MHGAAEDWLQAEREIRKT
ncbi:MAG: DUF2934 domain-containing protein [Chromatiaceae bacterium]|nr:DUF2934 domain-containing protein [Chromatiaceae bacterium]